MTVNVETLTDRELLDAWMATTKMKYSEELSIVRELIMDEVERRYPVAFEKWLASTAPEDKRLVDFIIRFKK